MSRTAPLICIAVALAGACAARAQAPPKIAWIDPANPFSIYLEAAASKKHVPVVFTVKKKAADLLVDLSARERKGSTWRAVFTANSGRASSLSMSVIDNQSGIVEFSYTCHKGGHAFGFGGHKGFQSAAECLAKHWKSELKKSDKSASGATSGQ